MSPELSARMEAMAGSATSRAAASPGRASSIDLGAGSPDWAPPAEALEAARAALAGTVSYVTPGGDAELRRRLCADSEWHAQRFHDESSLLTTGGKEALFLGLLASITPGDRVAICAPYWPSFLEQVRAAGGVPVIVPAGEDGFPDRDSLGRAIDSAAALIVNSPSNPTGLVWPPDLWDFVARRAEDADVWVVLDAVYAGLCRAGTRATEGGLPLSLLKRTLVVDSGSKRFALPGLRIGWAVGPSLWIDAMRRLQDASTTHPSVAGQAALRAALDVESVWLRAVRTELDARRDAVARCVDTCAGLTLSGGDAGLYAWIALPRGTCDASVVERVQASGGPKVLPGSLFGAPGHVRVALRAKAPELESACSVLSGFV